MTLRINEAKFEQLLVWVYYYLGIRDGMSASLELLNAHNPEALKDAEWQTTLRSFLPPELAALREPHANEDPAVKLIGQQFTEIRSTSHAKRRTARYGRRQ